MKPSLQPVGAGGWGGAYCAGGTQTSQPRRFPCGSSAPTGIRWRGRGSASPFSPASPGARSLQLLTRTPRAGGTGKLRPSPLTERCGSQSAQPTLGHAAHPDSSLELGLLFPPGAAAVKMQRTLSTLPRGPGAGLGMRPTGAVAERSLGWC